MIDIDIKLVTDRLHKKIATLSRKTSVGGLGKEQNPWYKRKLEASEFEIKQGKNNLFYVRHKEWSNVVFIGPYNTKLDALNIVGAYIVASTHGDLRFFDNSKVHSLTVDNPKTFFIK